MKPKEFIRKKFLRRLIRDYYRRLPEEERTPEWTEVIRWLEEHRVFALPYDFTEKYRPENIPLHTDEERGLYYTLFRGHRLYYKDAGRAGKAKRYFNSVFMEQDPASPHRYLTEEFDVAPGDVVVDIGAAEGNLSLDVVERAGKVWIFEVCPGWVKALQATFEPWKEKVEIIRKMVSDRTEDDRVALDDVFDGGRKIDFVKIDVEGDEDAVIRGMRHLLEEKRVKKIALATYHRQADAEKFSRLLGEYGYDISFSRGYMIFRRGIEEPYLRRGILKAVLR